MFVRLVTALAAVSLALPAHATTLPVAPITIEFAQCFAVDPDTNPPVAGGDAVPCAGYAAGELPVRCVIHGDNDTAGTYRTVSRSCTVAFAFLALPGLCLTGGANAEVHIYGPGGEHLMADFGSALVAGHGALTALGFYRTDRYGQQTSSLAAAGTLDVVTQSADPCVVGPQLYLTFSVTGVFV
jgi:hypothetical protein